MASIYGNVLRSDGSEADRTVRIGTSWNSNVAFPRNGKYELDLGSTPHKEITVYVGGMKYANIYVDEDTRLDIKL
ncbi:MAG TPA: hypothetical protein VF666_12570 [Pyrinomonadaceae bacterium]